MKRISRVWLGATGLVIGLLAGLSSSAGLAQEASQPSPRLVLISNVNIFDGVNAKLLKNMHVLVKDDLIETVSAEPYGGEQECADKEKYWRTAGRATFAPNGRFGGYDLVRHSN